MHEHISYESQKRKPETVLYYTKTKWGWTSHEDSDGTEYYIKADLKNCQPMYFTLDIAVRRIKWKEKKKDMAGLNS